MKVAIVSESSADEAAVARLAEAVLGIQLDVVPLKVRHRGWPNVCQVLPNIIREVFFATDAEGLLAVIDADTSPVHEDGHDASDPGNGRCRICQLQRAIATVRPFLRQRPVNSPLRLALGLGVPSIEAWFRCGLDNGVSEASWINARRQNTFPYITAELKQAVYGTDRPSLEQESSVMTREVERIIAARQLDLVESLFPLGFGMLARELRTWLP